MNLKPITTAAAILTFAASAAADRPNIVWLTSEDNAPYLGCYGDEVANTPTLDALAAKGVRYTNACASAPASSPARNTLITGLYPTAMGNQHMRTYYQIPESIEFFPKYMQGAGYYTINSGKMDYNLAAQGDKPGWDETNVKGGLWIDSCPKDKPFFYVQNFGATHESAVFENTDPVMTDPNSFSLPPFLPDTKGTRNDRATYYDKMEKMDEQIGDVLKKLESEGVADDTIIFYFSDHGGVLGRSKRFLYEDGLHVPFIIYFPEKYKHLAPAAAGETVDDYVSFIDFAPTMLNLLGIEIPDHMQGEPFLGDNCPEPRKYVYAIRGRMGERYDGICSVRDERYKYIRNYAPYFPLGQHINFLWKAEGMQDWEREFKAGRCNAAQSAFFETKPVEELYDLKKDPHEINNLAKDKKYRSTLERMREAHREWSFETYDSGLIPEYEASIRAKEAGVTIYELMRQESFPYKEIFESAQMATFADPSDFKEITKRLSSDDSAIRHWAAVGCIMQPEKAKAIKEQLLRVAKEDSSVSVRITAVEALYKLGARDEAIAIMEDITKSNTHQIARIYAMNVVERMGEYGYPLRKYIIDLYKDYKGSPKRDDVQIMAYWKTLNL